MRSGTTDFTNTYTPSLIEKTMRKIVKPVFSETENHKETESGNSGDWISDRFSEIEEHWYYLDTLPFKITGIHTAGFLAKVKGLFAYVPFNQMPWQYPVAESWRAIAPCLMGKVFFCKIARFDREQRTITLKGNIPQFEPPKLCIGYEYRGLVTKVTIYGVFIDLGYHFNWNNGSVVGLLHFSELKQGEDLSDFIPGQEVTTTYIGLNLNGKHAFSNNRINIDWILGKPQALEGKIVEATVVCKEGRKTIELYVNGLYKAELMIVSQKLHKISIMQTIQAKRKLSHGDVILCEVIRCNNNTKTLHLQWLVTVEPDINFTTSIANCLDDHTIDKLIELKMNVLLNGSESQQECNDELVAKLPDDEITDQENAD
jgi:hypothetical protein